MRTTPLLLIALSAVPALAAPVPVIRPASSLVSDLDLLQSRSLPSLVSWLCDLPRLDKVCQRTSAVIQKITNKYAASLPSKDDPNTVTMPLGRALGAQLNSVTRYTVPYAKAPIGDLRFKPTISLPAWQGVLNATSLAPACAQSTLMSSSSSLAEDCLFMNVHVPAGTSAYSKLPVFVWLHGGSFVSGSAGDNALDGSILAEQGKMIVITVQYRLGVFGFLNAPSLQINGNMGILDIVEALSFIQKNIASFGGDAGSVTLAGQSSGASLIKTLLSAPRADSLFHRAVLQSAPLNYGDHTPITSSSVGQLFLDSLSSPCTDLACLQKLDVQSVLNAQDETFRLAPAAVGPQVSASEPIRPVVDGSIVSQPFVSLVNDGGFNNKNRALIFTTVKNEAGPTIASISSDQVMPSYYFEPYVNALMDASRASTVISSGLYAVDPTNADGAREQLELLGTDWIWRCPNQQAAVNATSSGNAKARVWLAEFDLGIPYVTNTGLQFCKGKVCHQDDIEAVFSTGGDGLTAGQETLEAEVLARWSAFAATGNPNPASGSGYLPWNPVSAFSGNVQLNMLKLDGETSSIAQDQRRDQCGPSGLWGNKVLFDEQIYI